MIIIVVVKPLFFYLKFDDDAKSRSSVFSRLGDCTINVSVLKIKKEKKSREINVDNSNFTIFFGI